MGPSSGNFTTRWLKVLWTSLDVNFLISQSKEIVFYWRRSLLVLFLTNYSIAVHQLLILLLIAWIICRSCWVWTLLPFIWIFECWKHSASSIKNLLMCDYWFDKGPPVPNRLSAVTSICGVWDLDFVWCLFFCSAWMVRVSCAVSTSLLRNSLFCPLFCPRRCYCTGFSSILLDQNVAAAALFQVKASLMFS